MPLLFTKKKTTSCGVLTQGDKYVKSVEDTIESSDAKCFLLVKCHGHWDLTEGNVTEFVAKEEKKAEVKDAVKIIRGTGSSGDEGPKPQRRRVGRSRGK